MKIFAWCIVIGYFFVPQCWGQDQQTQATPNQQTAEAAQPAEELKPGLPELDANQKSAKGPALRESARDEILPASPVNVADMDELARMIFSRRAELPGSPEARPEAIEASACPRGAGAPCALLGGRAYYPDAWHITEHQKTWWDAFKTPGMLFSTGVLIGATVVDIEGTQHCIHVGACRESNPLMGQKSRAQKYAVAMSLNGVLTWFAVREKQHGRGIFPFFVMWTASSVHLYYGANGMRY